MLIRTIFKNFTTLQNACTDLKKDHVPLAVTWTAQYSKIATNTQQLSTALQYATQSPNQHGPLHTGGATNIAVTGAFGRDSHPTGSGGIHASLEKKLVSWPGLNSCSPTCIWS